MKLPIEVRNAANALARRVTEVSKSKPNPCQFQADVLGALQKIPMDGNPETVKRGLHAMWNDFGLGQPDWN
jgi:hypothetical protein